MNTSEVVDNTELDDVPVCRTSLVSCLNYICSRVFYSLQVSLFIVFIFKYTVSQKKTLFFFI